MRYYIAPIDLFTYLLTYLLKGHIKTTQQRTIVQQDGDWYTGH